MSDSQPDGSEKPGSSLKQKILYAAYPPAWVRRKVGLKESVYSEVGEGAGVIKQVAKSALSNADSSVRTCPKCHNQSLTPDLDEAEDADTTHVHMHCSVCGFTTQNPNALPERTYTEVTARSFRESRLYAWGAIAILFVGCLLTLYSHSLQTLFGTLAVCMISGSQAIINRYRGWQYSHKRLFESKPPIKDWLQWERENILAEKAQND